DCCDGCRIGNPGVLQPILLLELRYCGHGPRSAFPILDQLWVGPEFVERSLKPEDIPCKLVVGLIGLAWRRRRYGVEGDGWVERHRRLENPRTAKLRVDEVGVEETIGDVLSASRLRGAVAGRATVEVGGIDAVPVVSVAIEALEPIQSPGDSPIVGAEESLQPERVDRTVQERIRPRKRAAALWHDGGPHAQRLAITEVGIEVEAGFPIVAQTDKPPWHARSGLDRLIERLTVLQPLRLPLGLWNPILPDMEVRPIVII